MNVETAEIKHIPELLHLMIQFYSESGYVVDTEKAADVFRTYISLKEFGNVFIAVEDSAIIGYLIVKYYLAMGSYGFVCSLEDLFVVNNKRRKKAGSALIEAAIDEAYNNGIKSFNVEVGEGNTGAIKLYEKYGFMIRDKRILIMEKEEI